MRRRRAAKAGQQSDPETIARLLARHASRADAPAGTLPPLPPALGGKGRRAARKAARRQNAARAAQAHGTVRRISFFGLIGRVLKYSFLAFVAYGIFFVFAAHCSLFMR